MSKRGTPAPSPSDRPEPVRHGGARALADLLPEVGGAAFRRFGFVQTSIIGRWSEIVGARFAGAATPDSIRFPRGKRQDGTLHLVVHPAYGPMIQHVVPEIIERVNRFFGYPAIARVACRQGEATLAPPRAAVRAAPPSLRAVPAELGESLRTVADPELRAVLEALAAGVAGSRGPPHVGGTDKD